MAYNFTSPVNRYALKRQDPLTQGAQQAEEQNNKGLTTGQFGDVQSAQVATDRANAQRTAQGLQATRGTIGRSGELSPEAALRAQDQAFAASSAQNLNATNSVNQLQRQYRNDALNRSSEFESNAQRGAAAERDYQSGADVNDYSRGLNERAHSEGRADTRFGQGMQKRQFEAGREDVKYGQNYQAGRDTVGDARYSQSYNDSRGDVGFEQGMRQKNFEAGRDDSSYARSRDTVGDKRYDQSYNDSRGDVKFGQNMQTAQNADSRSRFDLSRGDSLSQQGNDNAYRDKAFNAATGQWETTNAQNQQATQFNQGMQSKTFDANQAQQGVQNNQWDRSFSNNKDQQNIQNQQWNTTNAQGENRFNLTRQDQNSQFSKTFDANRDDRNQDVAYRNDQANTQKDQWGQTYNAGREDAKDNRSRFDLARQDSQDATRYAQGRDAIGDTRYDQSYNDSRGDVEYNRSQANRIEGKGDAMAAINNIQDPKARSAAMQMYTNGEPIRDILSKILTNGTINSDYQSMSPGTAAFQAKVDELKSYYPGKTDAEIEQIAMDERNQDRITSRIPANAATTAQEVESIKAKIENRKPLDPKSGDLEKAVTAGLVKKVYANEQDKINNPENMGKPLVIDDKNYTVTKQDRTRTWGGDSTHSPRHTNYSELTDENGKVVYSYNGTLHDSPPKKVPLFTIWH